MGIFSDNVRRYHEHGLVTIPCKDKRPILGKEWERFCNETPTETEIDKWESQFKDINQLGLTFGQSTLLSGFDFDYEYSDKCTIKEADFAKDKRLIERQILAILPPTPCVKKGKKGWTRIYRSHGGLENAQADRNGVRLFDFLARNKQTIIPPSIYSDDADFSYQWLGVPIEDCLDEIPFITQGIVDEIKLLLGEHVDDNSRHGKLFKWIIRQSVIEKSAEAIAEKLVSYDQSINNPAYLADKKHHSSKDAMTNAISWVKRVLKWKNSKPKGGTYELLKTVQSSREMFYQFFEQKLGTHKKDLLSNRLMKEVTTKTKHKTSNTKWTPVLNLIPSLRSDAMEIGLPRQLVEDHLIKYQEETMPELLLNLKEWDGVDRIDKICRLVPATNIVPNPDKEEEYGYDYKTGHEMYVSITKDIAAGIFRRAFDSMEQNLFTIIRGGQGVGKNTFIEKLYGIPFRYYSAEVNVGMDMAKNYDAVEGRLVCIIGEFDQTQKIQISFLKELITNASFTARRAYERASDRYELKQTFFSACNFENVLKDSSGNRRFVIFDMPFINMEYMEYCDTEQLLAQYYHLYNEDFRMSQAARDWIKKFNEAETPEDPMDIAVESYVERIKHDFRMTHDEWLTNFQVEKIIKEVCKDNNVPQIRFRQTLNRRKLTKRSNGMKYRNLGRDDA